MSRAVPARFAYASTVLALLLSAGGSLAGAPQLWLKAGRFDPRNATGSNHPPADLELDEAAVAHATVRLLQFQAMPDFATRLAVEAAGGKVLAYLPEQSFVVRVEAGALLRLRALPGLRWDGVVQPIWKLAPDLGTRPITDRSRRADGRLLAVIELWPDSDAWMTAGTLEAAGIEISAVWTNDRLRRLLVRASLPQLHQAVRLDDVAFIEEAPEPTLRNDGGSWVVQTNVPNLRSIWDHGIHGEGQVLGNIDGALDLNSCYFNDGGRDPGPVHRKVVAYRSSSGRGADSHGTHTNGTMAGDRGTFGAWDAGDGHAFAAKISFGNLDDINGSGSAPSNLLQALSNAHSDGARVHSNSWGDDGTRQYTSWSKDIDDFSWQFEDSLVMFAVSNGGIATTPENAKDVFAVGASDREANANNHCSGGTGPTIDGRRKPEIYAPGCSTVSAASGQSCNTRSLTGTSMASPAVTGAAGLVRQYFTEGWYPSGTKQPTDALIPSGALMKAVIVSGAQDMTGVGGYPSNQEGWGRVNLERSLFFDGDVRRLVVLADLRRAEGLQAAQSASYSVVVNSATEPLRITLAFTDPPATLLAADPVINNLNLKVTAPNGTTTYWGNNTNGNGESVAGGTPDAKNNLEQVLLTTPAVGNYTVEVLAAAVPQGPQGFALVATGDLLAPAGAAVALRHSAHRLLDSPPLGNNDATLDPGETITLPVTLENRGSQSATSVTGSLSADHPEVIRVTRTKATWPTIASRASAESLAPHFEVTAAPAATCGQTVRFTVTASADATEPTASDFTVEIGNPRRDYPDGPPKDLPRNFFGVVTSPQTVVDQAIVRELDVSVDISHGNIGELIVALVAPSGKRVTLHSHTRSGTANLKTRFDRDRAPDGPGSMDDFIGEQVQGTWQLSVGDNVNSAIPPGRINGWTLHLTADRALSCHPLSCSGAIPGVTNGLTVTRQGTDLRFNWTATATAAGYHLLGASGSTFADPVVVGNVGPVTQFTEVGGANNAAAIRYYQIRALNSCNWEGP